MTAKQESRRDYVKASEETIGVLEMGVAPELPAQTKNRARSNPFDRAVQESYEKGEPHYAWVLDVETATRAIRSAANYLKLGVAIRPGTKESDHTVHEGKQYHCIYFQGKDKRGYDATDSEGGEYANAG